MYIQGLNPSDKKEFWKATKFLTKKNSPPPVLSRNGVDASTSAEKAAMLNTFFAKSIIRIITPILLQWEWCFLQLRKCNG